MRRLRFSLIILFSIFWLLIVVGYFLLQTNFGAKIVSQQLSKLGAYSITIGKINHSFANFYELSVDNLLVKKDQQEVANIGKLIIGFDKQNLWQLHHFNYINLIDGTLDGSQISESNFTANMLRLYNTTLKFSLNNAQAPLLLQQINGGIKPFDLPSKQPYQFDFTAQQVLFKQKAVDNVLLQGYYRDGITSITNLGGNIDNGFFVSKLKMLADGSLDIAQLKLNNIHFNANNETDLNSYLSELPKFKLQEFSIFDSNIQLPNLVIEKGNMEITNIGYDNQWQLQQSNFIISADNVVWFDEIFSSLLLQLSCKDDEVDILKAVAGWSDGNVQLTGNWKNNALHLQTLLLASINYQLPDDLKQRLLPNIFSQVDIDQLTVLPSTLISTKSDYPFNLTDFNVSGTNIRLVEDKKFGIYSGSLFFKANDATINKIAVKYPNLSVSFDSQHRALLSFSALINSGQLDATATINPLQTEFESLHIIAKGITSELLNRWKLVETSPESSNYRVDLHGEISPFSLSGTFFTNDNEYSIHSQH